MSISEMLRQRVAELVESGELLQLEPLIPDDLSYTRTIWVTPEVLDVINSGEEENWIAERHRRFEASLDAFINWEEVSVSENPFDKNRETFLARVAPIDWELWDIRTIEPPQGMRCLGGFVGQDEFIALVYDYRENYAQGEFDNLVERCHSEWLRLFGTLTPHSGGTLDAYLTKYVVA